MQFFQAQKNHEIVNVKYGILSSFFLQTKNTELEGGVGVPMTQYDPVVAG